MESIYQYSDFRKYLSNFYEEKKKSTGYFTYRYFAEKAGFKSPNQLQLIMQGKRNLAAAAMFKCIEILELNKREAEYFKDMVGYGQAKHIDEKNHYYKRMLEQRKNKNVNLLEQRHYEYLSKWYHAAVRELITMRPFNGNYQELGRSIWPHITAAQAEKAVELLLELGLVKRNENGTFSQTSGGLTTGPEAERLAVVKYHQEMLDIGKRALTEQLASDINICAVTAGVSQETYCKMRQELQQFQEKMVNLAAADTSAERVYQLNFQLFPLSEKKPEKPL